MNLIPNVTEEAKDIQEKTGFYIPPQRLSILLDVASKITKIITNIPQFTVTYRECEIILDIVVQSIKKIKG
jgi:hypothetical protein